MVLNRKSAKSTSRVSLFVAVTMITTMFAVLHAQGYQVDYLAEDGAQLCQTGIVELLSFFLF